MWHVPQRAQGVRRGEGSALASSDGGGWVGCQEMVPLCCY